MSTCPNGHQSGTDDWCEVCGHRISSAPAPSPAPAPVYHPVPLPVAEPCPNCGTHREGLAQFCEECRYNFVTHAGTVFVPQPPPAPSPPVPEFPPYQRYESQRSRPSQMNRPAEPIAPESVTTGSGDFLLFPPEAPAAPPTWTATVGADRDYFTEMMARSGPEGQGLYFPTYSPELQVPLTGTQITIGRRRNSTGEAPDIDLARAPEDPGVSHKHAILVQQPDSTWSLIDQDSTNGTTVNGAEDPIDPFVPVPLHDGDRVHVGAWTTITIRRD